MNQQKQQKHKQPSIKSALKLYWLFLFLVIIGGIIRVRTINAIGIPEFEKTVDYCGMISSSILFVFLLFYISIKIQNIDVLNTFELKRINYKIVILSIFVGVAENCAISFLGDSTTILLNLIGIPVKFFSFSMPSNIFNFILRVSSLVIFTPLWEELLCRGYILSAFKRFGYIQAIVFTAFLFSLGHTNLSGLIPIGLSGIFFGYLLYRTDSIFSSILAHGASNGATVLYYSILPKLNIYPHTPTELRLTCILGVIGSLALILLFKILKKQTLLKEPDIKRFKGFWTNIKSLFKLWIFWLLILVLLLRMCLFSILGL